MPKQVQTTNLVVALIEHRVFHRLSVRLRVRYALTSRQGDVVHGEGSTVNLSAGGLLLGVPTMSPATVADLLEGLGSVQVALALAPGEPEIDIRCRLVWLQGPKRAGEAFELGLRFVDLPSATRDRIHAFVMQMTP